MDCCLDLGCLAFVLWIGSNLCRSHPSKGLWLNTNGEMVCWVIAHAFTHACGGKAEAQLRKTRDNEYSVRCDSGGAEGWFRRFIALLLLNSHSTQAVTSST